MDLEPEALSEGPTWNISLERTCCLPVLAVSWETSSYCTLGKSSQGMMLSSSSSMKEETRQIPWSKSNSNHGPCMNESMVLYFLQTFSHIDRRFAMRWKVGLSVVILLFISWLPCYWLVNKTTKQVPLARLLQLAPITAPSSIFYFSFSAPCHPPL